MHKLLTCFQIMAMFCRPVSLILVLALRSCARSLIKSLFGILAWHVNSSSHVVFTTLPRPLTIPKHAVVLNSLTTHLRGPIVRQCIYFLLFALSSPLLSFLFTFISQLTSHLTSTSTRPNSSTTTQLLWRTSTTTTTPPKMMSLKDPNQLHQRRPHVRLDLAGR